MTTKQTMVSFSDNLAHVMNTMQCIVSVFPDVNSLLTGGQGCQCGRDFQAQVLAIIAPSELRIFKVILQIPNAPIKMPLKTFTSQVG